MDWHEPSEVLSTEDLNHKNNCPNNPESWVGADTTEDVDLVIDLSGTNHVENLHENEQVENDSKVSGWSDAIESLVHRLLLSVLLHSHKDVEVSTIPLLF